MSKLQQRKLYQSTKNITTEEEYNQILDQLEKTGSTGNMTLQDIITKYEKNSNSIINWDAPISFPEFCKKVKAGEYNE